MSEQAASDTSTAPQTIASDDNGATASASASPPAPKPRTLLDAGKQNKIFGVLVAGGSRSLAAAYVGCCPATIRNTALRDPVFAEELKKAESGNEVKFLAAISKAANEGRYWRAAAWALERKYPDKYALKRADTLTVEQVKVAFEQFASVVVEELADLDCRRRVLKRLKRLERSLRSRARQRRLTRAEK